MAAQKHHHFDPAQFQADLEQFITSEAGLTPVSYTHLDVYKRQHNLINLFKEHLNDRNFHPGLEANRIMNNFEKVLTILTESSWMRD